MDLLKKEGIELGKVYTDKTKPPFKLTEGLKRWKVYVSGVKEPFIFPGTDKNSVKELAQQMMSQGLLKFKVAAVVREEKITEKVDKSKVDKSFTRVIAFVRKEAKKLNDDDLYAMTQKLAKWFK